MPRRDKGKVCYQRGRVVAYYSELVAWQPPHASPRSQELSLPLLHTRGGTVTVRLLRVLTALQALMRSCSGGANQIWNLLNPQTVSSISWASDGKHERLVKPVCSVCVHAEEQTKKHNSTASYEDD